MTGISSVESSVLELEDLDSESGRLIEMVVGEGTCFDLAVVDDDVVCSFEH